MLKGSAFSDGIKGFGAKEPSWNLSSSFYCVYVGKLLNISEL